MFSGVVLIFGKTVPTLNLSFNVNDLAVLNRNCVFVYPCTCVGKGVYTWASVRIGLYVYVRLYVLRRGVQLLILLAQSYVSRF